MLPSEVRAYVLKDHERIRGRVQQVERMALQIMDGHLRGIDELIAEVETLTEVLFEHMAWEDRYLRPALLACESEAPQRVARFDDDHVRQRELFALLARRAAEESRPPLLVAGIAMDLVRVLVQDMIDEEADFLDAALLRDEPIPGISSSGDPRKR